MPLLIKGLQKTTLVDYPDKVACTIFLPKCSFRCGFCYNKDLVIDYNSLPTISENEILMNFKYANFRDAHWVEAINHGIQSLNARGFFRQTVNELIYISANSRSFSGPTNCVDAYQLTYAATSGTYRKLPWNWSYQQDANKFVMGSVSSSKLSGLVSYLRNLRTYTATSATLDILDDWVELVKLRAGEYYFRHMASKIATQGAATIDEGHFSFTNIRTMANDMGGSFSEMATRKKPTRPAKDVQWHIPTGGVT